MLKQWGSYPLDAKFKFKSVLCSQKKLENNKELIAAVKH